MALTVGVLALQGAFLEHLVLLRKAASQYYPSKGLEFIEVRNRAELARCSALVIPGGESTTLSLVAERSGLLEPLREFVKVERKPTWGTCAGLILLAEAANATKKGGQELIGGLDVRVHRNHFGRQIESFETDLYLPFLAELGPPEVSRGLDEQGDEDIDQPAPFHAVFIRAPIVDKLLPHVEGEQLDEAAKDATVVAPSKKPRDRKAAQRTAQQVDILSVLPSHRSKHNKDTGDIIAVRQGNVFGTSFHPELTDDTRIHAWWLQQVLRAYEESRA